jgi:hypothetical protein
MRAVAASMTAITNLERVSTRKHALAATITASVGGGPLPPRDGQAQALVGEEALAVGK